MYFVALFTRAWIEIDGSTPFEYVYTVALFTRAWIEIFTLPLDITAKRVALFTRAWIEIMPLEKATDLTVSRPLHEGVD